MPAPPAAEPVTVATATQAWVAVKPKKLKFYIELIIWLTTKVHTIFY